MNKICEGDEGLFWRVSAAKRACPGAGFYVEARGTKAKKQGKWGSLNTEPKI